MFEVVLMRLVAKSPNNDVRWCVLRICIPNYIDRTRSGVSNPQQLRPLSPMNNCTEVRYYLASCIALGIISPFLGYFGASRPSFRQSAC